MIVDSSAVLAILLDEPDAQAFAEAMHANPCRISAANFVESAIVIDRRGDGVASRKLDELLRVTGTVIADVTPDQARLAREAHRRFGRGAHPAKLNFGDCFAYALSKATGEPLLFKGDDFANTDVTSALG